jgi:hypothetical protein
MKTGMSIGRKLSLGAVLIALVTATVWAAVTQPMYGTRLAERDYELDGLTVGTLRTGVATNALSNLLIAWTEAGAFGVTSPLRSSGKIVTNATVTWPDGTHGVYSAVLNVRFQAIDSYTITYTNGGKTVTQAAVTRDGSGSWTVKPDLVVTP